MLTICNLFNELLNAECYYLKEIYLYNYAGKYF